MTYEPTKEDVERAVQILNAHFPTRCGEFYEAIAEALYAHHRSLAERGVFVGEWKPIETAPKMTRIIIGKPSSPVHIGDLTDQAWFWATRWMPLPPEPES